MAANILSSIGPVRDGILNTIGQQPVIRHDFPSDVEMEDHLSDLETYLDCLNVQRERFNELHKLLLSTTTKDEAMRGQVAEVCRTNSLHLMDVDTVVAKYTTAVKRLTRKRTASMMNGNGNTSASVHVPAGHTPVKLPKLQLPTFGGDVLKWTEFWDCFKASVHQSSTLSNVDKMNYLKAQLSGPAKEAIAGLASDAANYGNAIKILERRFGDQRIIVNAHYSALNSLAPASGGNGKLRETFDAIEQHVNSLSALGQNVQTSQMVSTIRSKLPYGVLVRLDETHGEDLWDVKKLRESIHNFLAIRESAEHTLNGLAKEESSMFSTKPKRARTEEKHEKPTMGTASILLANAMTQRRCVFCKGDTSHWATECQRYPTVDSRKQQVQNRCFNCLGDDHVIRDCPRKKYCFYCKQVKAHHSSLCPRKFSSHSLSNATSHYSGSNSKTTSVTAGLQSLPTSISILAPGESVLLQTASTEIRSTDGSAAVKIRLILDSGSQRTYITKAMAKRLKLKPKSFVRLTIFTFGSRDPKHVDADVVDLQMKLVDGTFVTLEAHAIPAITGGFSRVPVDFSPYQSLYGNLPFADSIPTEHETVTPDFLIGLDDYWTIVTGQRILLTEGLYLIGSKLGWLLTGRVKAPDLSASPAILASETVLVCAQGITVLSLD